MAETKVFRLLNGVTSENICDAVEGFLRDAKAMTVQSGKTVEGYFIQGKQESDGWKKISGTDLAISVQIFQSGDVINVTVGYGKWSDKIGAGALGWFVAAPLAITAVFGAMKQKKLPQEIFDFMEKFILSGGQSVAVGLSGTKKLSDDEISCPSCKAINPKGTKFCCNCGTKLLKQCPGCGTDVADGIKFCPECGQALS